MCSPLALQHKYKTIQLRKRGISGLISDGQLAPDSAASGSCRALAVAPCDVQPPTSPLVSEPGMWWAEIQLCTKPRLSSQRRASCSLADGLRGEWLSSCGCTRIIHTNWLGRLGAFVLIVGQKHSRTELLKMWHMNLKHQWEGLTRP